MYNLTVGGAHFPPTARTCGQKVGYDRGNDGIGQQLAALFHVAAVDVQDVVAGDDIALFIHAQTAAKRSIRTDLPFAWQARKKCRIFPESGMRNGNNHKCK